MKDSIKSNKKGDLSQNSEFKYSNNQYNIKNLLSIPLISAQIFKFIEKDDIKCLSFFSKKIYQLYSNLIKKLKTKEGIETTNISNIKFDKYEDLIELDLDRGKDIKIYAFISNLKKLEINSSFTQIFLIFHF